MDTSQFPEDWFSESGYPIKNKASSIAKELIKLKEFKNLLGEEKVATYNFFHKVILSKPDAKEARSKEAYTELVNVIKYKGTLEFLPSETNKKNTDLDTPFKGQISKEQLDKIVGTYYGKYCTYYNSIESVVMVFNDDYSIEVEANDYKDYKGKYWLNQNENILFIEVASPKSDRVAFGAIKLGSILEAEPHIWGMELSVVFSNERNGVVGLLKHLLFHIEQPKNDTKDKMGEIVDQQLAPYQEVIDQYLQASSIQFQLKGAISSKIDFESFKAKLAKNYQKNTKAT